MVTFYWFANTQISSSTCFQPMKILVINGIWNSTFTFGKKKKKNWIHWHCFLRGFDLWKIIENIWQMTSLRWLNNTNFDKSDFSGYSSEARWEQDCTSPAFSWIISYGVSYSFGWSYSSELFIPAGRDPMKNVPIMGWAVGEGGVGWRSGRNWVMLVVGVKKVSSKIHTSCFLELH